MSWTRWWTCRGGPGNPGSITDSEQKNVPSVSSLVAFSDSEEPPIEWFSPSPGAWKTAPTAGKLANSATRLRVMSAPDVEPIPLARPDLGAREEELAIEVLRSGRLSLGPMLERFERDFAGWLGAGDAVAVSSGTAALHLGVRALAWGPGDEGLTTPLSFVASANCLLYEGATPVFCDIDPETLDIDPAAAQSAADNRQIAGILPVHIFGYPADLLALEGIADAYEIPILEDA